MTEALDVIRGALQLGADPYLNAASLGAANPIGLWIALLAGLSQAIGQAFILFVNQVRPPG